MHSNRSFARRRAMFTSSLAGRYVRASVDSCMDNGSEEGDESSVSARSTRSLRSFRHWKKAQRRRRHLEKASSVFEFSSSGRSLLGGNESRKFYHENSELKRNMSVPGDASTFDDGIANDTSESKSIGIDQPLAIEETLPYYSSSPLTTSESDSEEIATPERSPEPARNAALKYQDIYTQSVGRIKDPLQRRPYPFLQQADIKRYHRVEENKAGLNDESLFQDTPGLHQRPSLFNIASRKSSESSRDTDSPTESPEDLLPNVFHSETGSFTVTVPMNSPSLSTPQQSLERSSSGDDQSGDNESNNTLKLIDTSNQKRHEWNRQNSIDKQSSENLTVARPELLRQKSIEVDPGMYFLPPLVTTAMRHQYLTSPDGIRRANDESHIFAKSRDDDSEKSCSIRNISDINDDIRANILLETAERALPESDTCSMATECSGVEDIDPERIEQETFAENAEIQTVAVETEPDAPEIINLAPSEDCLVPPIEDYYNDEEKPLLAETPKEYSHKVHKTCDICDRRSRKKTLNSLSGQKVSEALQEDELSSNPLPNGSFTHKLTKDKNCPVCNRDNNIHTEANDEELHDPEKIDKVTPHDETHCHEAGDYLKCPECALQSQYPRPNTNVLTDGLCCVIV